MGSMEHRTETHQAQTLSPRFQHAVRLLQMSSVDFAATVQQVLGHNPFLEIDDREEGVDTAPDGDAGRDDGQQITAVDDRQDGMAMPTYTDGVVDADARHGDHDADLDRDPMHADPAALSRYDGDGETSALDRVATETPLNVHLHAQLAAQPLTQRALWAARSIVESLDDDGYLRTPLDELRGLTGLTPPPTLADLEVALGRVQALDPIGVAARSVAECLTLQLPSIECPDLRALAERVVRGHLPLLAARDVGALARQLGETPLRIQSVCDRIRRFDPHPGWRFSTTRVAYVVPDVVVRKVRGAWRVQLNPVVVPRVRLNQVYAELFKRHRRADNADLAGHLQEARWTVRNVEQRFSTILDVAEAIVRRQQHFLEFGPMAMKPLGLREIAEEVGVHESTVSRVTNNKFIATPSGVFELKHFFSRVMVTANGSACSGTAIRGLLKDLIEAEPPDAPLSDAEITRQLAQQGLVVARRTVTKYRQSLRIEAVDRRRRVA